MYETYQRIFTRCGLAFRAVEADTGNIGGSLSHEFQVLTETGEDALVACDSCDYAANVEQAVARAAGPAATPSRAARPDEGRDARASTPSPTSRRSSSVPADKLVKTLIYLADGKPVAVLVRGDRDVNEIKLKQALGADARSCSPTDATVREVTGAPVGFAGPVGLKVPVYCDLEICALADFVVGRQRGRRAPDGRQPRARLHADGVRRLPRPPPRATPARAATGGTSSAYRGIEVGQVFFLGTKYSKPMGVTFLDAEGTRSRPRWAATASASRASSRRRSSRTTTRTASSGRCRSPRSRSTVLDAAAGRRRTSSRPRPDSTTSCGGGHRRALRRSRRARGRQVQGRRPHRHPVPDRGREEGARRGGRRAQAAHGHRGPQGQDRRGGASSSRPKSPEERR